MILPRIKESGLYSERGLLTLVPAIRLPHLFLLAPQIRGALTGLLLLALFGAGCAAPPENETAVYHDRYGKPLISPGTQFSSLPPAVQHTVRAQTGMADIVFIEKEMGPSGPVYAIHFSQPDLLPTLYVANDGSLLNPDMTVFIGGNPETANTLSGAASGGLALGDLPPAVVRTIQQRAPDAEVGYISKQVQGDSVSYLVTFKNQLRAALLISADGTVLREIVQ
ncbi:MAG TPA: hypothetical protein VEC99_03535 [Clostridia bacterium]|nr:hypothetical protein [Clostridia bacterium]